MGDMSKKRDIKSSLFKKNIIVSGLVGSSFFSFLSYLEANLWLG